MKRIANSVSLDDIKLYFSPKIWKIDYSGDTFEADSGVYKVNIKFEGYVYHVKVWAYEDESDSKEGDTMDPSNFIRSFVGFEPDSSRISSIISRIARLVFADKSINHKNESIELSNLKKNLKDNGWDIIEESRENGMPSLYISAWDEYESMITIERASYLCEFSIPEASISKKFRTDDPIKKFREFHKDDDVSREAEKIKNNKIGNEDTEFESTVQAPEPIKNKTKFNNKKPDMEAKNRFEDTIRLKNKSPKS